MRSISSITSLLLGLALTASCDGIGPIEIDFTDSTRGQRTDIEYSWEDFAACGFGCNLERPLVTGSTARIRLDVPSGLLGDTRIEAIDVASGDAELEMVGFELDISGNYVDRYLELRGLSPGLANLDLLDEEGNLIDTIGVSVADVAEVSLKPDTTDEVISVGDATLLWIELFDNQGRGLVGYPRLSWTIRAGADLVTLRSMPTDEVPITSGFVQLEALAKGNFEARVQAPGGAFTDVQIEIE